MKKMKTEITSHLVVKMLMPTQSRILTNLSIEVAPEK